MIMSTGKPSPLHNNILIELEYENPPVTRLTPWLATLMHCTVTSSTLKSLRLRIVNYNITVWL